MFLTINVTTFSFDGVAIGKEAYFYFIYGY